MNDDAKRARPDLGPISKELSENGLSRRGLLDRLKGVGVGFGAAFLLLGARRSEAHTDATATLKSTNPALSKIIEENPDPGATDAGAADGQDQRVHTAFVRAFRRVFRRVYSRI